MAIAAARLRNTDYNPQSTPYRVHTKKLRLRIFCIFFNRLELYFLYCTELEVPLYGTVWTKFSRYQDQRRTWPSTVRENLVVPCTIQIGTWSVKKWPKTVSTSTNICIIISTVNTILFGQKNIIWNPLKKILSQAANIYLCIMGYLVHRIV